MSEEIKTRNDFQPEVPPPSRPTSMPPQGKVWQAAGPYLTSAMVLVVSFAGALTGHISNDFLEKVIGWVLIGTLAASTPLGVLEAIKHVIERR